MKIDFFRHNFIAKMNLEDTNIRCRFLERKVADQAKNLHKHREQEFVPGNLLKFLRSFLQKATNLSYVSLHLKRIALAEFEDIGDTFAGIAVAVRIARL